jgi:hypothetical protein
LTQALQDDAPAILKAAYRSAPPELRKKLQPALAAFGRS